MKLRRIWITEQDLERLKCLVRMDMESGERENLQRLETRLKQARIVKSNEIPEGVITMNCLVKLFDLDTHEKTERWLRFSTGGKPLSRVVPILSDLGVILLGSEEGDTIEWLDQSGKRKARIMEIVYQPERLGNYQL